MTGKALQYTQNTPNISASRANPIVAPCGFFPTPLPKNSTIISTHFPKNTAPTYPDLRLCRAGIFGFSQFLPWLQETEAQAQ